MLLISPEYVALNAELHARNPKYGTSGQHFASRVYELATWLDPTLRKLSVLDYGCGKGTLKRELKQHFPIAEYDPAIGGKTSVPAPAAIVVCTDVLEHVEPDCVTAVLDHIASLAQRAVLLSISTQHAQKTLADGRNAHLIVQPLLWWLPKLLVRWNLRRLENHDSGFLMIGTVR